jgi:anaerobic ribonucleoside-triphosphate reductase
VTHKKLEELTPNELLFQINRGLDVECITRITGYFAKTRSFNPGKTGELKERYKPEVE